MKKKLSRLLCALLVLTMVLAMVPAVLATDGDSKPAPGTANNPYILYVGDTTHKYEGSTAYGCSNSAHTYTLTYTEMYKSGRETVLKSAKYVTYDKTTGSFKANAPTYSATNGFFTLKVNVKCNGTKDAACSVPATDVYFVVYSLANGITLSNGSTTLTSLSLHTSKGTTETDNDYYDQKIYYTLSPVSAKPDCISVSFGNSNIKAELDGNKLKTGSDSKGSYFMVHVDKGGIVTKMDITLDNGAQQKPYTKSYDVVTDSSAALTLKSGNTVLATSTDDGDASYEYDIGATISITATADAVLGKVTDIEWVSSDSKMAGFVGTASNGTIKLKINTYGKSTITATLGGATAMFEVRALKNVTSIEILDSKGNRMDDQEVNVSNKTLTASVSAKPTKYADAAHYAVWSITDTDVLDFDEAGNNDMYQVSNDKWQKNWTIDPDTGEAIGNKVRFKALRAGTVTVSVKLGNQKDSFRVTVKNAAKTIKVTDVVDITNLSATVRNGTEQEIVDRVNANSKFSQMLVETQSNGTVYVPVRWITAYKASNTATTATVYGQLLTSDGDFNYDYSELDSTQITLTVKLTNDAAVTNIDITGSKSTAVENDVVRLTANATVEPSSADVAYQWYVNGKIIDKATSSTVSYTIPKASEDSSLEYKFTCEVTATYKKNSTVSTSKAYVVSVDREYSVSVQTTSSKSSYTVGEKVDLRATLYRLGSAQSNSAFTWLLLDSNGNNLSSNIATISGSGATATVTTKAVKNASGDKIVVRATSDYKGYSSSETITIVPAAAATVTQSVGSGALLKASNITSAINKVIGSSASVSYLIFDDTKNCTLTKSSSSSSTVVDTKCYISGSGQKLSDVYVKTSASSASATYVAYDSDNYVLATGTVSFDSKDTTETITASGASLKTIGAIDQITSEYAGADYVKFDLPEAGEGKLYYDYTTISDFGGEVKDSDKYYLDASSSQNDIEDVYILPAAGVTGKFEISYTAFSSSNSDLGRGKITLTIKSKNASDKFTDVSTKTGFQWAADSIDFGADNGIIKGATTYTFAPSQSLTRAQLVTLLYRAAGSPSVSGVTNPFKDTKNDYSINAILWAYKNNIVTGTSATTFSPESPVTREQIAAILYRYMGSPTATGVLTGYTDRANVSTFATTAMQWAIGKGYINGIGTKLDPKGNATRAQVAVILHRFLTK